MRNRITSFELVAPSELDGHAMNWREHPNTQRAALREVLERVGIADVLLTYRSEKTGRLTIIDGHLRKEVLAGEEKVPVVILDVNDEEAAALLTTHDPIAAMAMRNDKLYQELLGQLASQETYSDLVRMLDIDRAENPAGDGDDPFADVSNPTHPIAPVYDEGYDAVIIACATEVEWAQVQTLLRLPPVRDRKGRVGTTHVISAEEFTKLWQTNQSK